jgi:hypothetical protein
MPSNKERPLNKALEKTKSMYCNKEHVSGSLQQAVNSSQPQSVFARKYGAVLNRQFAVSS